MWLARAGAPLMTLANRLFGREPLYTSEALDALESNPTIHHAKAAADLGHSPRPLDATVRDLYAWFGETGRMPPGWRVSAEPMPG